MFLFFFFFFFQAEDGIRDLVRSRGLGDVYKRQIRRSLRSPLVRKVMKPSLVKPISKLVFIAKGCEPAWVAGVPSSLVKVTSKLLTTNSSAARAAPAPIRARSSAAVAARVAAT